MPMTYPMSWMLIKLYTYMSLMLVMSYSYFCTNMKISKIPKMINKKKVLFKSNWV